jgi:drug/metabolite transporter (DMT)-like permease
MAGAGLSDTTRGAVAGIGLAAAAFAVFTVMDCTVKALSGRYHVLQIVWLQAAAALAVMLAYAWRRGGAARLRTRRLHLHVLRGCLALVSITLVFASYAALPLADVYAVLFTIPLMVAALGVVLLGERISPARLLAIALGFSGVMVTVAPTGGSFGGWLVLLPLAGAAVSALGHVLVRHMQATETTESFGVYGNLVVLLAATPALPFLCVTPTLADLLLAALGGTLCALGSVLLVQAYRAAPVAVVAPLQYTQMPYAVIAGLLLFGDPPQPAVVAGAAIVAASGVFLLVAETHGIGRSRTAARAAA